MAMSKILIIDDDLTFVTLLTEELGMYGQFEVLTATREKEEIALLKQEAIDLVLVDIDADNIDDLEFLSFISTDYPSIPSIVMARENHPDISTVNNCSNVDSVFLYLLKPSQLQEIGGAIVEGLYRIDENDFLPGIAVVRLLHLFASKQKTCRLFVKFGAKKQGYVDFENGILKGAGCDDKEGEYAVAEMISWPPVSFEAVPLPVQRQKGKISQATLDTLFVSDEMVSQSVPSGGGSTPAFAADFQKKIRLFIIDDSPMMRKVIANIFADDHSIEVVGEASNGKEALQILPQLNADVVTLDVQMPVMDGITTLKHMMIQVPIPTVMLSAFTSEGAVITHDSLKYGAVDFVAKPSNIGSVDLKEQAREISRKVHLAAAVELSAVKYIRTVKKKNNGKKLSRSTCEQLVAIGAAEGGYGSLLKIIPQLPEDLPAAYLVILYTAPQHVDSFVEYLNNYSSVMVKRAKNNDSIESGVCYLASGEEYLTVHKSDTGLVQHLSAAPFAGQRGAVNMLMFSVAEAIQGDAKAVILSGLGKDGTEGMEEIMRIGGSVIVQDPRTCLYKEMVQGVLRSCATAQVVADSNIARQLAREFSSPDTAVAT